jgi:23S rRNA pseudouridine1911/1915/1917 synthase
MTLTADRGDAGRRLDLVVCRHLAGVGEATRTRVQSWIADGLVAINGRVVRKAAARAAAGDVVRLALELTPPRFVAPEPIALDVVFEDDHLIAVNKPPGLVVHPTYQNFRGTLLNALAWRARDWPSGQRPSLVGRLDRLTSGLVIAAKTPRVHAALHRTLAAPASRKSYLTVVYGRVSAARGRIDLRLRHNERDRRRMIVCAGEGVASVTDFERLASVEAPRSGLALLECRLVTGRRHQVRAHLAAKGWPIVGDADYGEPRWTDIDDDRLALALRAFPRQALHAWRTVFAHPVTGAHLTIEAPLPHDIKTVLSASGLDK